MAMKRADEQATASSRNGGIRQFVERQASEFSPSPRRSIKELTGQRAGGSAMDEARVRSRVETLKSERGVSMVELLVFIMMLLFVLSAGTTLLIVSVKSQPRISDRNFAIQQGRAVQERFARELRQSSRVEQTPAPTSSSITFDTYVRRTQCGGAVETDPTKPAIGCKVTYTCTAGACYRAEAPLPGQPGATTTQQLVSGLSSGAVFGYSPDSANADYVTMRLVFPAAGGDDAVTLDDGVDLRNR
jgi:Tfp pilus assembly protein PilW